MESGMGEASRDQLPSFVFVHHAGSEDYTLSLLVGETARSCFL
jgi:hypothetical protein